MNAPILSNPNGDATPDILAATVLIVCLATITVLARLYVRLLVIRNTGWDDWLMVVSIALSWAGQGVIFGQLAHGAGRHIGDVDKDTYKIGLKLNFVSKPIFLIALCIVKLSVGCALLRIASTKFYRYMILSIMGFMVSYTIGCFFILIFQCTDIHIFWDNETKATCWPQSTIDSLSYTYAALNIITDLLFAIIIPMPMLLNLNVHIRTRLMLIGILGLGVFVCAAASVRLSYVTKYGKDGDLLWDSRNITIWTSVELNIGIIAGSLPCLRPLFKRFLGSMHSKSSRQSPDTGAINDGHGTLRSGSNWHTLWSGRRDDIGDETSSQQAINTGIDEYELRDGIANPSDAKSSNESIVRIGHASRDPRGITKTITTRVRVRIGLY
ncbi:hypothetical protein FOMG_16491 [Fusarium oxysporum f. sp. melonis 26406]|uniref:Rhodopsin domain-containing protein n=1 Tax=Fusarium oxysporum f. sp. melonis 26406 TaxID=1089452 RepID=W9ZFK8_FUSOX|nr:hypothetical protein FOMG_16491 [Fusarium oxysporum f. sp. melonis 26406]